MEIKYRYFKMSSKDCGYFLDIGGVLLGAKDISLMLEIPLLQYKELIEQCGAKSYYGQWTNEEYYHFKTKDEANACIVALKLISNK